MAIATMNARPIPTAGLRYQDRDRIAMNADQIHIAQEVSREDFEGYITPERRQLLVVWVTGQRDTHGDEIGLHIHPYCNFVDTTSVPCRTEPSTVYAAGDATARAAFPQRLDSEGSHALAIRGGAPPDAPRRPA